jgi:hypothetical protein
MKPVFSSLERCVGLVVLLGPLVAGSAPTLRAQEQDSQSSSAHVTGRAGKRIALKPQGDARSFDFETEQMAGTIRLDGPYHGVTRLVDKRTGRQMISSKLSALNLYRLMSVGQVLGMPRTTERTIRASSDWVEVKWAAEKPKDEVAARRQVGELTARYEVYETNVIEVTITVRSLGTFAGFEVFLPNYFDKALRPHIYLQPRGFGRDPAKQEPDLVVPMVNDAFRGTLLAFPRDDHAARLCLDGRWDRLSEIQVSPVRHYAHCLAVLTDPEKQSAVVLMARPRHCYAISARYHADNDADRLAPYSAFDFALFGDDLLPGNQRSVKVRLALTALEGDLSRPLKLYRSFLSETNEPPLRVQGSNPKGEDRGKK